MISRTTRFSGPFRARLGGPSFSDVAGGGLYELPPCYVPSECRPEVAHSFTQHAFLELG